MHLIENLYRLGLRLGTTSCVGVTPFIPCSLGYETGFEVQVREYENM